MSKSGKIIIGKNVKLIRKAIGLSLQEFSTLTEISKTSIVNIEKGKTGYNLDLLEKVTRLTGHTLHEISFDGFVPEKDLRQKLIESHPHDLLVKGILEKNPDIVFAIKNKLLKSQFFSHQREVKEIKRFFLLYNWEFKSSSITNALSRMPDVVQIAEHPDKKNTNLYTIRT